MKLDEMTTICKEHMGVCKDCPLNVIEDWQIKLCTWCLLDYRLHSVQLYRKAMKEGNLILAQQIENDYKNMEKRYLEK